MTKQNHESLKTKLLFPLREIAEGLVNAEGRVQPRSWHTSVLYLKIPLAILKYTVAPYTIHSK